MDSKSFNDSFRLDAVRRAIIANMIADFKEELKNPKDDPCPYVHALHHLIVTHSNKERLLAQTLPNIVQHKPRILFLLSGFNSIVEYPTGKSYPIGFLISLLDDSPQEMCLSILQASYHLAQTYDEKIPIFFIVPENDIEASVSVFLKLTAKLYKRSLSFLAQAEVPDLITGIAMKIYNLCEEEEDRDNEVKEDASKLAVGSFEWYMSKMKDMEIIYEILESTKNEMSEEYRDIVDRLINAVRMGKYESWELLKVSLAHWFVTNKKRRFYDKNPTEYNLVLNRISNAGI